MNGFKLVSESENRRRNKRINFWITEMEHDEIESRAAKLGLTISDFLRMLALDTDIDLNTKKIQFRSNKREFEVFLDSGLEDSEIQEYFSSIISYATSKISLKDHIIQALKY